MKKLIISAIIASVAAFGSFADVMNWQVTSPVVVGKENVSWNYAALWYVPESGNAVALNSKPYNGTVDVDATKYISADSLSKVPAYAELVQIGADYTGYSFYIELYGGNDNAAVAKSQSMSYNQLSSYVTKKAEFGSNFSSMNAFFGQSGITWTAVPEPTSGLLLLLGMAGLALRRRKV